MNNLENFLEAYVEGTELEITEDNNRKNRGYWDDPQNILKEARQVMENNDLEKLPNKEILAKNGYSSLAAAITRGYPGKYIGLRKDLGETVDRKEYGYWDKPKNIEKEIRSVMKEHKLQQVPSSKFLREIHRTDLAHVISTRYPGGYKSIREKFGETYIRKNSAYWKNLNNIKETANKIIDERGTLPGKTELAKLGYTSFAAAVVKYHKGFRRLRKLLNQDQKRVKDDYWTNPSNLKKEVRKFKREQGFSYLPTQKILGELGYTALSSAISSFYPGGFDGYRESNNDFTPNQLRRKTIKKTPAMLRLEEKIKEPIEKYLQRNYQTHSSAEIADELDISENSVLKWLKRFGIDVRRGSDSRTFRVKKPDKETLNKMYWKDKMSKQAIAKKLKVGIKVIDTWFSQDKIETREDKRVDISKLSEKELIEYASKKYNGLSVTDVHKTYSNDYKYLQGSGMIEILIDKGIIFRRGKKNGFWNKENTFDIAVKIYQEYGYLPTQTQLGKIGYGSLPGAAAKHFAGLRNLREIITNNVNNNQLESLLEQYVR